MRPQIVSEEAFKEMQTRVRGGLSVRMKSGGACRSTVPSGVSVPSPYKSKWEAAYASKLELEKRTNHICEYWYEPFSLWLPGKIRYKPDFLVQYFPQGHGSVTTLEIIEVKGWSKNRRDGMTRLKMAAALFPCFVWRMVYRTKQGGWDGQYI